jgi:5-hydroxyisourate hydrolase-like protein (transthyretin family)
MLRTTRRRIVVTLVALLALALCGLLAGTIYALRLPDTIGEQNTLILGQSELVPGAPGALHIRVQSHTGGEPVPDAQVEVSLRPADGGRALPLFEGRTGDDGQVDAVFLVPEVDDPAQQIVVETHSRLGRDTLQQAVTVERSYKVLLTTDKPIYQPGQQILVRALALGAFDQRPAAGSAVELTIADAKGNKVFRQTATTSAYGVAAWTFQLADQVNHGNYKLTATLGDTASEKTVVVKPYVLPKFGVTATTDDDFYRPGQRVTGRVEAAYFFGKAVDGGQVQLAGWVYDFERRQVLELSGQTDADGGFAFEFDLPDYFVGAAEGGVSDFILEVSVTDGAAHTEQVSIRVPVAQQAILIEAVPESGSLKPGLENIIYLLTAYPDGSPAECDLTVYIEGQEFQASTGPFGLGDLRLIPINPSASVQIQARDALGHTGEASLYFEGHYSAGPVLLRPEQATARVGETLNLEVLVTDSVGSVYLDVTREGQTLSTRALDVRDGRATAAIDLTPDLYGTLALHAYKILPSGEIARDTRLVVVDAADDLALDVRLDRDTYLPGQTADLQINVSGTSPAGDAQGVPAALGLAIVDESVFALQEQDPGFARLYFMLEKELLEPKFDLHGLSLPELMGDAGGLQDDAASEAQQRAAQASLAGAAASLTGDPFSLSANSHAVKVQQARERQDRLLGSLSSGLFGLVLAVPLVVALALGYGLWRERVLGRSLALGLGLPLLGLGWLAAILFLVPLPGAPWADTPIDKLGYLIDELGPALLCLIGPAILGGLAGVVGLAVRAVRKGELPLGLGLLLSAAYGLLLLPLFMVTFAATDPSEPSALALIAFAATYLLLPLAFGARAAGFGFKRQGWSLVAAGFVALLALFLIAGPIAIASGMSLGAVGNADLAGQRGLVVEEVMVEGEGMMLPVPTAMPALAPKAALDEAAPGAGATQQEAPLLRQFFPETMYWNPEAVTDESGHWQTGLDLAHTITTWRLTALASAQDGRLGSTTAPIRVFQDFFVDIDLPLALTQGDEVSMPVAVYNYLDSGQRVALTLEAEDWFEFLGPAEQAVDVAPGDVTVVYFPIKVTATEGRFRPVVTAIGEQMSDATTLRHDVQVLPDGKRFDQTLSDRLEGDVETTLSIPADAIPGTAKIYVKLYPGILSQVVEGLDALLRMPFGCFEQTSSMTYPNVLVLDYLKTTNQASPEAQMKAEEYINLGYQRLTTFEVPGGGFSLFGSQPADRMLTAYGLLEFSDMARVHPVDQAIVDRAAAWLLSQQRGDGSWENDQGLVHENSWSSLGNERLPVTAYIVWALSEAGYEDEAGTAQGLDYVREFWRDAEDAYALALVANGLAAADPEGSATEAALDRLAEMAIVEGSGGAGSAYWQSDIGTFMGATGDTGSIETTALAAYAFLRAGRHTDLANQALTYLVREKDSYGTWHSTQATVQTLKALLLSVREGGEGADATVRVTLNGEQADPVRITEENFDVVQTVSFSEQALPGDNRLRIKVEGQGNLMYQVSTHYYLPWDRLPPAEGEPLMEITVDYDRTELAVNDTVEVSVRVELKQGAARQAIVDLGVPPGFDVASEDLADLVARHSDLPPDYEGYKFSRFDLTGRQIICYLEGLKAGESLSFSYRIRARYPIKAQTPPSSAYDYYNPAVSAVSAPAEIEVNP